MTFFNADISNIELIFAGIFLFFLLIQLLYYFLVFIKPVFYTQNTEEGKLLPVSVVICAKNEAESLKKNLPGILEQDYPDYEVMVVDDCSEDDTDMVIAEFRSKYKHLKSTTIHKNKKFTHGKKLALTVGIKGAKNEHLLLTDSDCYTSDNQWIKLMQRNFIEDKEIVLGYGPYEREKTLLNNLIRFDAFFTAMQYFGYALARLPYMGVGRNLAYTKSLFFSHKGFASHSHIPSGDDDLFVNEVATKKNVAIELDPRSFTFSEPCHSIKAWAKQKKRHLTTGVKYKPETKFLLAFELFSRFAFYALFAFFLMVKPEYWIFHISCFGLRMISQLIVFKMGMMRLKEKNLLLPSLLYDVFLPFINFIFYIANSLTRKEHTWS